MKYTAFAQLFREKALGQNDTTAISTATISAYANLAKDRLAREIVTHASNGAGYFSFDLTTDLVEDQREYAFPGDVVKNLIMVQAYIDSKWRRVYPFDVNTYRVAGNTDKPYYGFQPTESFSGATTDETTITEQFSDTYPQFFEDGRTITIYSETIDAVTAGLKLKALIYPKDYEDTDWSLTDDMSARSTTTSTAMPRQSHDVLLTKAVIDYKETKGIALTAFEMTYNDQLRELFSSLSDINDDEAITAVTPLEDGYNF